jgi:hypothetical protein
MNFVKLALERGGSIHPLITPSTYLNGPALTNPSVYNDNGKILVNLRNINYTLYHSEKSKFEHHWGPLVYIHPENDQHLRTNNIMCEMDDDMNIKWYHRVDTSSFDTYRPMWEFVGLEDARIIRWDGKLYICGVRRDLDTIGTGRMELSEIEITNNGVKEILRHRIPCPGDDKEYCNKNWMPILDMPFHFVKWTNGTEIVKYNIETGVCETVVNTDWKDLGCIDLRGGSQVIPFGEYRLGLNHETFLYQSPAGRKDGTYRHRFIVWDKNWNIVKVSERFSFLNANIEFAVGMCEYKNDYLITFGFQDNAAYLIRVSQEFVKDFIFGNLDKKVVKINPTDIINKSWFNYGSSENKEELNWTDVPGWFSHSNTYKSFVDRAPNDATFVEIGTFMGRSTCCMGELIKNSRKNIKFYTIDTFAGSIGEEWHTDIVNQLSENDSDLYQQFLYYAKQCKVDDFITPIRSSSLDAVNQFDDESLDMIYVDGGHTYGEVFDDITAWYPKLKTGGIIAGDDYGSWPGVNKAVNEYFKDQNLTILENGNVWEHQKP